jgi:DNA (cytosine-5)-methyltransferase 1
MTYGSVCSGIESATVAWHQLGWTPKFFAEIAPFPSAVLKHHYPGVKNYGDFTKIDRSAGPIDVLVGGTPCQSFSVAGLRKGLADDRGNLALEFLKLADRLRPRWLVWENVPGVFSSITHDAPDSRPPEIDLDASDGPADGEEVVVEDEYDADETHAFACFLAGLQELGYGVAYRTLDAQFFGVPQRRRRVFVVGCLGDWHGAAAVLSECHSLSGDPPPSREKRERTTGHAEARPGVGCVEVAPTLNTTWGKRSAGSQAQEWDSEGGGRFVLMSPQHSQAAEEALSVAAKAEDRTR